MIRPKTRKHLCKVFPLVIISIMLLVLITGFFPPTAQTVKAAGVDTSDNLPYFSNELKAADYANADAVVIGTVKDKVSYWDTGKNGIYSSVVLVVNETLKGKVTDEEITITYSGGEASGTGEWVSDMPTFNISEQTAVLLDDLPAEQAPQPEGVVGKLPEEQFTVYGGYKGKFTIAGNMVGNLTIEEFREKVSEATGRELTASQQKEVILSAGTEAPAPPVTMPFLFGGEHWPNPVVNYRINENTNDCTGEGAAVQAAAETWTAAGAKFSFNYTGTSTAIKYNANSINEIMWRSLTPGTLAVTHIWYTDDPNKHILECDMEFNDDYNWSSGPTCPSSAFDIQTIALHEFGHYLMLRDLYNYAADRDKAMYGVGTQGQLKRSLHPDDIAGICDIYGRMVSPPEVINKQPDNITQNSARLNGDIYSTGGENCFVHIYWGTSDGKTNPAGWDNDFKAGTRDAGDFNANITGLPEATTYYYRCYAENSAGGTWAGETISFTTLTALTIAVSGNGTTTPETGTHLYNPGETVAIEAISSPNWVFLDWSGEVTSNTTASTSVTMNANKTITANFERVAGTVTLNIEGSGTISPAPGDHTYPVGASANITATPAAGWRFAGWTGDNATIEDTSSLHTSITINDDYYVTALFDRPVLTIEANGEGITEPTAGEHEYDLSSNVTLTASPAPNWTFLSWSGDVWDPQSATTNVTMSTDTKVTANFVRTHGTITLAIAGNGNINPPAGVYTYEVGAAVNINAVPEGGWKFVYWSGDISTLGNTDSNNTTLTINGDYTVTANFIAIGGVGIGGGGGVGLTGGGGTIAINNRTITSFSGLATYEGTAIGDIEAESADAKVKIEIAKGTAAKNRVGNGLTSVMITSVDEPDKAQDGTSIIGNVYEFGPKDATFEPPIAVTIKYNEKDLPEGITEDMLRLACWDESSKTYVTIESRVDKEKNLLYASISHFSRYTVFADPKPAEFTVSGLVVNPPNPRLGDRVEVTVTAKNNGDLPGNYTDNLTINGLTYTSEPVDIDGRAESTIHFTAPSNQYGTYNISIGDLKGSYSIDPPAPAYFGISSLNISENEAETGEPVEISILVANTGETEGDYIVTLKANDEVIGTKDITLPGGASQEVVLVTSFNTPGKTALDINGLTGSITIKEKPLPTQSPTLLPTTTVSLPETVQLSEEPPAKPLIEFNWVLISAIIMGCMAILGCVLVIIHQKKHDSR